VREKFSIWSPSLYGGLALLVATAAPASEVDARRIEDPLGGLVEVRTIRVEGARMWLRAVPDGSDSVVFSAEAHGSLLVGRMDPLAPRARIAWMTAAVPEELPEPVADHAHIFAHGIHWIAFSTRSANLSFLLRLDRNLRRLSLTPVSRGGLPTNDLFLVAEPDGVAVGHFLPGVGHRIFRFDRAGVFLGTADLGGGRFRHANGASAETIPDGYRILAPETLDPTRPSAILEILADPGWRAVSVRRVLWEPGANLAMTSSVPLPTGGRILLARVRTLDGTTMPGDDAGAIVRYRLDPRGRLVAREPIVASAANRPGAARMGELLLTTYEARNAVWLRVERVGRI